MMVEPTLGEAVLAYLNRQSPQERDFAARELNRFARWFGFERPLQAIQPIDLERFQEQIGQTGGDVRRLEPLRAFLSDAKQRKLLESSLAVHVRVRKRNAKAFGGGPEAPVVEMTETGFANLKAELEHLERDVRPQVQEDMQRAAADKDMRENAPYHAAKEKLSEIQSRMNYLKNSLNAANIVGEERSGQRVGMGSTVVVRDEREDEDLTYTLVGPGEIDLRRGRISIQSPLGRALSDRCVGETVEVDTPAGRHRYRVERIESI
jgi:transcription elongation factor GreA